MNGTERARCAGGSALPPAASPRVSALMFSAGLAGNLLALALLLRRRRRRRPQPPASLFHALVLALVLTDLLGTCCVSPLVLASYHRNRTLSALAPAGRLCVAFGFCMSFFGLATMLILFAMALERCLALGRPYCYERLLGRRAALGALPAVYAFSAAFCSLPLLGFGRYDQYCPGTWCFIQMHAPRRGGADAAFSLLYASLLLLLVAAVLLCNLSVIGTLVCMHRRGQKARGPAAPGAFSMAEEIDHLLLLSIMTITFVICSLPFTIRAYINQVEVSEGDHEWDLLALRFLSMNPIVDPWVFAILRPPLLRLARSVLCCQAAPAPRSLRPPPRPSTGPASASAGGRARTGARPTLL